MSSTFLFADLAGFTALTEVHGDQTAADLVEDFCAVARTEMKSHEAEEIKTIGDAMMIRVPQAEDAVRLGLRLAERVGEIPGLPILRVGMNTGSAVERSGDWFGSTVNIAARVAAAAGGDEVLLTEATRSAARQLEGIELEALGRKSFRNVSDRVALFRALPERRADHIDLDPVCRMTVDPRRCAGELTHEGRTYRFCSLECASAFAAEPDKFALGGGG